MTTETETPAGTMRRAARDMRKRAEEAVTAESWEEVVEGAVAELALASAEADYIAGMHPGVALAVAALLEREAALIDSEVFPQSDSAMVRYPLAVARAYLGETGAATTGETA